MNALTASVPPTLTRAPEMTGTYLNFLWAALALVAVFCVLIWLGWRNRKRRQAEVPEPQDVPPELLEATPQAAAEGMVIGTVKGGQYLDRIAVHELGLRTTGRVEVHPAGVAVFRSGVRNIFIPAEDLAYARTDRGMIGKFVEKDGAVILGWRLGATDVDTGFRPRRADEGRALVQALNDLTEGETTI
jgi:hypothetical protein